MLNLQAAVVRCLLFAELLFDLEGRKPVSKLSFSCVI